MGSGKVQSFYQLLQETEVVIPMIQRDYAQGRLTEKVKSIRHDFLDALYKACKDKKPLHLDFIYGEEDEGFFKPFDGQQRLTTLYLLHWYAAVKAEKLAEEKEFFNRFGYEIRESTRVFIKKLNNEVVFSSEQLSDGNDISSIIKNARWYVSRWELDQSISGMLVMLDAIHKRFSDIPDLWKILTDEPPLITFFYKPLQDLSLSSDELYIKMNARGKQLTEFENFKAKFVELLREKSSKGELETKTPLDEIERCFDTTWIQVFWDNVRPRGNAGKTRSDSKVDENDEAILCDKAFARFLRYIGTILYLLAEQELPSEDNKAIDSPDDFRTMKLFAIFRHVVETKSFLSDIDGNNIDGLKRLLDGINDLGNDEIDKILKEIFYKKKMNIKDEDENGGSTLKIALYNIDEEKNVNIFSNLIRNKNDETIYYQLLLFAFLLLIWRKISHDKDAKLAINENDIITMREALRPIRNLLENSASELRYENYADQLRELVKIILTDRSSERDDSVSPDLLSLVPRNQVDNENEWIKDTNFNVYQINEEAVKQKLRRQHKGDKKFLNALNRLENHEFFRGNLGAFSLCEQQETEGHEQAEKSVRKEPEKFICFDPKIIEAGDKLFSQFAENSESELLKNSLLCEDDYALPTGSYFTYGALQDIPHKQSTWNSIFNRSLYNQRIKCRRAVTKLCNYIAEQDFLYQEDLDKQKIEETLKNILEVKRDNWLEYCEKYRKFFWRYYLVKYSNFFIPKESKYKLLKEEIYGHIFTSNVYFKHKVKVYWNPFLFCVAKKLIGAGKKIEFLPCNLLDQRPKNDFEDGGLEIEKGVYLHGVENGWRISSSPTDSADCNKDLITRFKDANDLAPLFNNDNVVSSDKDKDEDKDEGIIVLKGTDKDLPVTGDEEKETCRLYDKVDRIDYIVKFFKNRVS
ncbi:DUF262 domain-containing protein [Bartonella sp. M0187]|uniref:DUF262 domain-containing protein n=1 Tax=Bartonella apihabitans TaxID=2750929 RepID=UPI0018DCBE70|nr:DUF262 domain-containing protein [Bartonella apihabitans]MBI0025701.1 DUF262 domain-containing protein [Bartonella apihabitans]